MQFKFKYLFIGLYLIFCSFTCRTIQYFVPNYDGIAAMNSDSTVNMIIEIPAGTTAKYEMDKSTSRLKIDSIDGKPRFINYLGYPVNYGMIPNTLLPKNKGGDGDPLDVLLLGPALERASLHKIRVVGVLKLEDNNEQDDKLIGVPVDSNWYDIKSIDDLDKFYPGSKLIIKTFFENYKGKDQIKMKGWGDKAEAIRLLNTAISN